MKFQSLSETQPIHLSTSGKKTCFPSELGFLHEDIRPPVQKFSLDLVGLSLDLSIQRHLLCKNIAITDHAFIRTTGHWSMQVPNYTYS